jgi:radical SAM superfamily enzyme YgiQ (UPF0313 family)
MRVCLVCSENESLGVEYLSAVLKSRGFDTELLFDPRLFDDSVIRLRGLSELLSFKTAIVDRIAKRNPGLVGFQVFTDNLRWALDLAREIKKRCNAPIVFGGIHPSSSPQATIGLDPVDYVVVGEGEYALLELAQRIEAGESTSGIANVWSKDHGVVVKNDVRSLIRNLDSLPFPDKDLFYRAGWDLSSYSIISGRSCPFNCAYCCNSFYRKLYRGKGRFVRRRSVANVVEELVSAKDRFAVKRVVFDDETFTHDAGWLRDFSHEYHRDVGLPSFCWVHPKTITDDVVTSLRRMGTATVEMGVQSIDPALRKKYYNRHYDNEHLVAALAKLKDSGIDCIADNIIGPEEDIAASIRDLIAFYTEHLVAKTYLFNLRAFPGTDIVDRLRNGRPDLLPTADPCDEKPFLMERDLGKDARRLALLLPLLPFLRKDTVRTILERKYYRLFPPMSYNLLMESVFVLSTLARRKPLFTRMTARKYLRFTLRKMNVHEGNSRNP